MEKIFSQVKILFEKKNLLAKVPIDKTALVDDQRFVVVSCWDEQGKKWLFKIQYLDAPTLEKNFLNEVNFLKLAQKYPPVAAHLPLLNDFGYLEGKVWYLREFIEGQLLGQSEEAFPYNPQILSQLNSKITARFFFDLAQIPLKAFLRAIPEVPRHDLTWLKSHRRFLQEHPAILKLKRKKLDCFSKMEQEKLFHLIGRLTPAALPRRSWALNHANLSPTNIIFSPPSPLVFIDWENVCWGYRTSGFDEFWYRSPALPAFQEEFFQARLNLEKEKEDFLAVFYFSIVITSPGLIDYLTGLFSKGKIEEKTYQWAVKILTKTVREGMKFLGK